MLLVTNNCKLEIWFSNGIRQAKLRANTLNLKSFGLVLMRLPRELVMQLIDFNLYRETWKTSLSTHPSWRDISPNYLRVVMVLYICILILIFLTHIVISISIRELIGIITSNYRLVDNRSYIFMSGHQYFTIHFFYRESTFLICSSKSHFIEYNCLHFTPLWKVSDMSAVVDHRIQMRDRCIICGTWEVFFRHPLWSL